MNGRMVFSVFSLGRRDTLLQCVAYLDGSGSLP
ncbi:hypothetical protein [Paenibacillus sp. UNC451MF]